MKFLLKIQRPFKNKDGNYDSDLVNVKVWTNNIDDLDISLRDKAIIAVKGRIQSFRSNNFDEENYYNRLLALLVKKLQIFVKKILIEKYNFN
ncbi:MULTISPECIES: single-stranded DNA-binding protein [Spiroplasma]|uniref:single-stranded DNA-binding protein n=1 Tax=Spiroplasma TaxID=2132 RepID=UPI001E4B151B|nr:MULTISPECIES: single-stranded DNA-binding protein [Spiroplasma]UNF62212.1 single-stranded DNA-binding protein [Spiroplasma poulsonii]